jgi:hypothetical protein
MGTTGHSLNTDLCFTDTPITLLSRHPDPTQTPPGALRGPLPTVPSQPGNTLNTIARGSPRQEESARPGAG